MATMTTPPNMSTIYPLYLAALAPCCIFARRSGHVMPLRLAKIHSFIHTSTTHPRRKGKLRQLVGLPLPPLICDWNGVASWFSVNGGKAVFKTNSIPYNYLRQVSEKERWTRWAEIKGSAYQSFHSSVVDYRTARGSNDAVKGRSVHADGDVEMVHAKDNHSWFVGVFWYNPK